MNKTKRFCAIALAAMMAATAFSGCNSSSSTSSTGGSTNSTGGTVSVEGGENVDPLYGEGENGPISLKVWGPEAAQDILKEQCAAFVEEMKPYGDITIEVVPQGEDEATNQVTNDPSAAADVFGFACDQLNKLVTSGNLLKVASADKETLVAANSEASIKAASIGDDLYAYPETADNSYVLFYDKRVVSDEQAKTLEGTLEACKAANKQFVMDAGNGFYSCLFMFTGGVTLEGLDENNGQVFSDYDEAKVVSTMLAFQNLLSEYKDIFLNGETTKVVDGFLSDTVGAGIDGSWNFANAKSALGENAGFAELPTINVDGEATPIVNMFGYKLIGVNSSTQYPSTSVALAMYLTNEECQTQRAEKLNWGPSNTAAAAKDIVTSDEALAAVIAQSAHSVAQVGVSDKFWTPMGTFGNNIVDFDNPLTEESAKELLAQTIANCKG